jgi:hypothetical protein
MGVNGFNGLNLALVCRHGWPRPGRDRPLPPCKVCVAYGRAYIEPEPDPTAPSAVWSPYPIGRVAAADGAA